MSDHDFTFGDRVTVADWPADENTAIFVRYSSEDIGYARVADPDSEDTLLVKASTLSHAEPRKRERYVYSDLVPETREAIEELRTIADDLRALGLRVGRLGGVRFTTPEAASAVFRAAAEVEALRGLWCSKAIDALRIGGGK
jgi:hypothetical protein